MSSTGGTLYVYKFMFAQPPVTIIGGARSLGRNHRRAERMIRRATITVCSAVMRLLRSLHHQPANALRIFLGGISGHTKASLGVELGKLRSQGKSALWDLANTSPLAIYHSKHPSHQFLGRAIPLLSHRSGVLIFNFITPLFELQNAHVNALQQVQRFDDRHYNRAT